MTPPNPSPGPERRNVRQIFRHIGALYSLTGAARKSGRRVTACDLSPVKSAAMVIDNGRISWTGPEMDLPKELRVSDASEVDLGGATVLPAFVEAHTHSIFAGNRAGEFERRNQGESYQSIASSGGGILATVLPTRAATEAELTHSAQLRIERFIVQGVTTVEVKSGYGLEVASELKMLRAARALVRARIVPTFLGAHAIPREVKSAEAYIDELIAKALPTIAREGLARRTDVFVEQGYFSKTLSARYFAAARALGFDLVLHADQLTRAGGAELAVEMGVRSADHLLCISADDVAALAKSDVTCVLLPSADLYMKSVYPPARALIDQGARVALATDFNPGTAPSQDLSLAGVLARVQMKMTLPEVIGAYTVGAAHALGLGHELGALVQGYLGDFVVLQGPLEELFLEIGRQPVDRVYREGQRLF